MGKRAPQPVDVEIGRNIRARRLAIGISQTELARGLGVTFQQIQKYERGVNRVGGSRMVQIAGKLRIAIADLYPQMEGGKIKAFTPPMLSDRVGAEVAQMWIKLARRHRIAIRDLVVTLMP